MCGIAGIICFQSEELISKDFLEPMAEKLVHRGPDDEGYYGGQGIGLCHRRLSIIDLNTGHQPLTNEAKNLWLVCNGEIFNFPELRENLEKKGHVFSTHSDSEVILHLYEEDGINCLQKLRGQFAFALWDQGKQRLFLARDRLGQKPLYYYQDSNRLIFSSEMKGILAISDIDKTLDESILAYYLRYGYLPPPHTQYQKIKKIPPAHFLLATRQKVECERYWHCPQPVTKNNGFTLEEGLEGLEEKILEATRLRLLSDVPLGAFLSGGVDSSLIVALMCRLTSEKVKTFNISFKESTYDESPFARKVAKHLGTDHHEIPVDYKIEDLIEKVLLHFDEPFADSSAIPQYFVAEASRKFVKVVLSGDAADELFGGYRRYLGRRIAQSYQYLPQFFRQSIEHVAQGTLSDHDVYIGKSLRKKFLRFLHLSRFFEETPENSCLPFFDECEIKEILGKDLYASQEINNPLKQFFVSNEDVICNMLFTDQQSYLPDDILVKVDRMSMIHALEVRSPFLDHVLMEWVAKIPLAFKLRGFQEKFILKKLAERFVPKDVLYRPKQGFAIPISKWFRNELKDFLSDELLTKPFPWLQKEPIEKMIAEHHSGKRDHSQRFWALLSLKFTFS